MPLHGRRLVVTRSLEQADDLAQQLAALGATPLICPVLTFAPLPLPAWLTPAAVTAYTWVLFTSANAVRFFWGAGRELEAPLYAAGRPQIASVGPATAEALQAVGVVPDWIPPVSTGEQLALTLPLTPGEKARILLPRARAGRPEIVARLQQQGAEVDDVPLYETRPTQPTPAMAAQLAQGFDMVIFTSPSTVHNFCAVYGGQPPSFITACLGPTTAAAAQRYGLTVAVQPTHTTIPALVAAIANFYNIKHSTDDAMPAGWSLPPSRENGSGAVPFHHGQSQ